MADFLTVEFDDVILSGYATDYVIQTIQTKKNFYEIETLSKWFPYLRDSKYVIDVGANLGNHTVYWSKKLDAERIISYEPLDANYKVLSKNIYDNALTNVTIISKAVGQHVGTVKLKSFDETNYGATSFEEGIQEENTIDLTSIDNEVIELNLPRVDFVKIDTEGFELEVLKGMTYVLDKHHPILWVECSEESIKEVVHILSKYGYKLFDIEGANVLFIQTEEQSVIDLDDILYQRFRYLTKTNIYYSNYIKTKEWLEDKNKIIENSNADKIQLKESLEKAGACCNEYKKILEQERDEHKKEIDHLRDERKKEIDHLRDEYEKKIESGRNKYIEELNQKQEQILLQKDLLNEAAALVYDNENALIEAKKDFERMQNRFNEVSALLAEDERKLGIIHNKWYWRSGLNFYLWIKKIKHRLMG